MKRRFVSMMRHRGVVLMMMMIVVARAVPLVLKGVQEFAVKARAYGVVLVVVT